jgi:hypothetical protein
MKGVEGFIAIFGDGDWNGTSHSFPQLLWADTEDFSAGKEIKQKPFQVGNGRVKGTGAIVSGPIKPEGGVTFQFRSDDCVKVLMSHFQMGSAFTTGSSDGTSNFRYGFYPSRSTPSYSANTGYGEGSYGESAGYVYSVSFLKKLLNTSTYNGTNAYFYKHGVCDKLKFSLSAERDARLSASYKFRDLDFGTAVPGTVGSYSSERSFMGWSATVLIDGQAIDLTGLDFVSDNGVEEKSRVGRLSPESFSFGEYSLKGVLKLDLPKDAMRLVGSMFNVKPFSVLATLYTGTSNQVVLDIPHCKYLPFDFNLTGADEDVSGSIPFQAFSLSNNYPIRVTVNTDYEFEGLDLLMDATEGARVVVDHEDMDGEDGPRALADYEILDRDA